MKGVKRKGPFVLDRFGKKTLLLVATVSVSHDYPLPLFRVQKEGRERISAFEKRRRRRRRSYERNWDFISTHCTLVLEFFYLKKSLFPENFPASRDFLSSESGVESTLPAGPDQTSPRESHKTNFTLGQETLQ